MTRFKVYGYKCIGFLLCFFLAFFQFSISIQANETKTQNIEQNQDSIRVGWYEDSLHTTGKNNERSGYGYEFEQSVAAYTGWHYTYVKSGWNDLMEKISQGQIDLMGGVSYTEQRAQTMLFSDLPMGKEKYYLYADLKNTNISSSNLTTLNGKRIGLLKGSVQESQFYQWESRHHLKLKHVLMTGYEDAKEKAANHELDCVVSTETPMWIENGMSNITTIGGSDIYFVVNKNRPDIKEAIDHAMRNMENDKPFYADDLYKKYLLSVTDTSFTKEEDAWLKNHGHIRMGCLKNNPGVSVFDEMSGQIEGVVTDYINFAKKNLKNKHLKFELVCFDTQNEMIQALKNNKIDLIFHFSQNPYIAEKNNFILSNTVLAKSMAAITSKKYFNEDEKNTVAIEKGNLLLKWYVSYNYPQWKIRQMNSFADCESAVRNKKVDCFIAESQQLSQYIEDSNLSVIYLTISGNTSFAVNRADTTLLSILNKTIKTIPTSMLTGALSMYENSMKKVTVLDFIKDNLNVFVLVLIFIFIIILALLQKSQKAEALAKEQMKKSEQLNVKLQENQNQLQAALLQAENANLAKTEFLNNMSHDIRTPMNAIIGFTDIALKKDVSPEVKDYLFKIKDSSNLLLALINDVLDISRIESGNMKLEPSVVNITNITNMAVNVTTGLLLNRKITFEVDQANIENPYVLADSIRVKEILVNVLSNAVKFTQDGGTIRFQSHYSNEGEILHATYVISDTGIGMSEAFQKHIFDEFAQEKRDARTQYKGTGLGMSIARSYVDMMHGTIRVQSEKGKGSTFGIDLPFKSVKNHSDEENIDEKKNVVQGMRILLAEDNNLNAEIAMVQLEEIGFDVTRVCDGKEAVDAFAQNPKGTFDVILMDVMMPNMNGYEATKQIRHLENRDDGKTIPIIALTANAFSEDIKASIQAGMNGHISKPIVMNELLECIIHNIT